MSHYVYLLLLADHSKLKVGFTKNLVQRLCAYPYKPHLMFKVFDLSKSVAVELPSKVAAFTLEKSTLRQFHQWKAESPWHVVTGPDGTQRECGPIRYGAGGHKEWLSGQIFNEAKYFLCNAGAGEQRPTLSLLDEVETKAGFLRDPQQRSPSQPKPSDFVLPDLNGFSTEEVIAFVEAFFADLLKNA